MIHVESGFARCLCRRNVSFPLRPFFKSFMTTPACIWSERLLSTLPRRKGRCLMRSSARQGQADPRARGAKGPTSPRFQASSPAPPRLRTSGQIRPTAAPFASARSFVCGWNKRDAGSGGCIFTETPLCHRGVFTHASPALNVAQETQLSRTPSEPATCSWDTGCGGKIVNKLDFFPSLWETHL